jgi:methyl-accepting chemotaxis protein
MASDNQAQAAAIQQIASAIGTMDESTQQNAAMVEQTSAAARSLNSEVQVLGERADSFRTAANAAPASFAAARPAAPVAKAPAKPRAVAPAPAPAPAKAPPKAANQASDRVYKSPVKPLPAAAVNALVRRNDDWDEF